MCRGRVIATLSGLGFFFQAEDGIRDLIVTGVQTCALPISRRDGTRFLLTSTSEVYGDPLEHPQVETHWGHVNPVGIRSCYDESKRYAEALKIGRASCRERV